MYSIFDSCYEVIEDRAVVSHLAHEKRRVLAFEYLNENQYTLRTWEFHENAEAITFEDILEHLRNTSTGLPGAVTTHTFVGKVGYETVMQTLRLSQGLFTCFQIEQEQIFNAAIPSLTHQQTNPPTILFDDSHSTPTAMTKHTWVKNHLQNLGIHCFITNMEDWDRDPMLFPQIEFPTFFPHLLFPNENIPLIEAILANNLEELRAAITHGANVNISTPGRTIWQTYAKTYQFDRSITGLTPLMLATYLGHEEMVRVLCNEFKANVHEEIKKRGQVFSAMDFALLKKHKPLLIFFLSHGAKCKQSLDQVLLMHRAGDSLNKLDLETIQQRFTQAIALYQRSEKLTVLSSSMLQWLQLPTKGFHGKDGNHRAGELSSSISNQDSLANIFNVLQHVFRDPEGNWYPQSLKPKILFTLLSLLSMDPESVQQNDQAASLFLFKLRCMFLGCNDSLRALPSATVQKT